MEIAFALPRGSHQESLIDGVLEYAKSHKCPWSFLISPESLSLSILDLRGWRGDGVIAALNTEEENQCAKSFGQPVVNISGAILDSSVPQVVIDNRLVGELAADHLLGRGLKHFAYYGLEGVGFSEQRFEGFQSRLAGVGFDCIEFLSTPMFRLKSEKWHSQQIELSEWLQQLPKPIGMFAVSDYRSMHVLSVSREINLNCPQQLALIGVDNEEVICRFQEPELSSVARDDRLEGYRAAELLDQLLRGEKTTQRITIPPLEVIERESTNYLAIEDERIGRALDFISNSISESFGIETIARHVGVSRRWLESRFRKELGKSPYQYVLHQRLEYARRILSSDRQAKIHQVARQAGFGSAKQFSVVFQTRYGMTPRDYRNSLKS